MSVTVLLPVYNGAATLSQAVESILKQDEQDFELLLIDDASRDSSPSIIRRYAAQDSRVTAICHPENIGLAATLNEGLAHARHDLVARMDQDDESLPSRLRRQCRFMDEHPGIAAAGTFVRHMGASPRFDRIISLPESPRDVATTLQRENCIYHPSVIVRRAAVLELNGYRSDFKNAEDYDLWLRLVRTHDLANIPVPLLRYRFSVDGMTLGRKWEQLRYVQKAQISNEHPNASAEEIEIMVGERLAGIDRSGFLREVATGTVEELNRLHLWSDAAKVATRFTNEIGVRGAAPLAGRIAWAMARNWRAQVEHS